MWRSAREWGSIILRWIEESGQNGSVVTLYELNEGDETDGLEFHGIGTEILTRALRSLESTGKAQLMSDEEEPTLITGVKFF